MALTHEFYFLYYFTSVHFSDSRHIFPHRLHGWICVYVHVCLCVCEWRHVECCLLQCESYGDANSLSHSHAWPKHMALRQHTLCLHVLSFPFPLPLSNSFFGSYFFLFSHPFPQLCLLLHGQWQPLLLPDLSTCPYCSFS